MYSTQQRPSNTSFWHTYMKDNSERSAIMRADQLKQQFPNMQVRVVDDNGRLIYQA
ncbi:hypothetical protein [Undibacterium sp. WLHG33]|jgi:hypothetical protein|uniref:hypothetical protein n=1 Tax=Undibacterium sp. WLHG33 TaxID=3412482 RepID=UPI003C2D333C